MELTYLIKQNGTVQVLFNDYKFCKTSNAPTKDGSMSYKCRVEKCGVSIKVLNDEVLNKCNVRKHNHNPLSSCEVAILTKIEELKIKVLVIFIL
jgi:hypothetical protein